MTLVNDCPFLKDYTLLLEEFEHTLFVQLKHLPLSLLMHW